MPPLNHYATSRVDRPRMCTKTTTRCLIKQSLIQILPIFFLSFSAMVKADLPYNPTRIFHSNRDDTTFLYILEPPSGLAPRGQLLRLRGASQLTPDKLPVTTITPALPFLDQDSSVPYNSVLDVDGSIVVYTGDCNSGSEGSSLWRFTPTKSGMDGDGAWEKQTFSTTSVDTSLPLLGANYLATPITFSPSNNVKDSSIFVFGGMCPSGGDASSWTSAAEYSAQMLHFRPDSSSDNDFSLLSEQGQPIAEAGFSFTPLLPTYSTAGESPTDQAQDFLLVGGHTQTAFINMTQVAVFSLPQAVWNFIDVALPQGSSDLLARRDESVIEPRSGHTAILSEDGSKIVIFGGWVGDVNTASQPQLMVLELGIGYGGTGSWIWNVPSIAKSPFSDGGGIYGHAATLLSGDILMVTGGYQIQETIASSSKRSVQIRNVQNYFFNLTSGTFLNSINPGLQHGQTGGSNGSDDLMSDSSQRAGLGAGIAFGALAVIVAIVFGCLYARKLRAQRKLREQEIQEKEIDDLANAANRLPYEHYEVYGLDAPGSNPWSGGAWGGRSGPAHDAYQWAKNNVNPKSWKASNRQEAERTGLDLDLPSPNRGLRRSAHGRGTHQMVQRFEDNRLSRASGNMHAIEEMDEEQSSGHPSRQQSQKRSFSATPSAMAIDDPFKDPEPSAPFVEGRKLRHVTTQISRSEPVSPISPAEERQKEMSTWIKDWSAAGIALQQSRHSPNKSDRTLSDLSDRSQGSELSSSRSAGTAGPSRAASSRSGRYLPYLLPALLNPFGGSGQPSPTKESSDTTSHSGTASRPSTGKEEESFKTAKSAFSQVQLESEALLGKSNTTYPSLHASPNNAPTNRDHGPHNRSRSGSTSRLGSWVGTVKRAIPASLPRVLTTAGSRSASMNGATPRPGGIGADGFPVYNVDGVRSASSSPTKRRASGGPGAVTLFEDDDSYGDDAPVVRRTVSDGANFWVSKRGAHDWDYEPTSSSSPDKATWRKSIGSSTPATRAETSHRAGLPPTPGESLTQHGESEADDWDVEAAAEGRCVQIMFTVPRERLRVVNADVDRASVSEVGDDETFGDGGAR